MAGGSAVIGILKALLTAETGEYSAAMRAAGTEAQELGKKLEKDLEPRQRTINKLVSEFLGGNEIRRAQEYAQAVEKLGGVTNLTAADQLKVNRAVNDALGHYQALGTQAPKNLTDLATATHKAETSTTLLGAAQKQIGTEIASVGTRIRDYALGFLTGAAALEVFQAAGRFAIQFLKDSVQEALAAEQAQRKLTAALQQQGLATPEIIKQFDDLATQFAKTTIHTDDLIIEMQGLLTTVGGVLPSQMEVALEAATNLSAGLGVDLRAATILVAKAFEDNFVALKKAGVQIDETRAKAEGMSYVLGQVQAKFGGQAQAEVDTYAGKIKQLGNAYSEMQEQLGKTLLETGTMDAALLAARIGMVFLQVEVMKVGAAMSVVFSPSKWAEHGGVVAAFAAELAKMNAEMALAAAPKQIKPVRSSLSQAEQAVVDRRKAEDEANAAAARTKKALEEAKKAQEAYTKAVQEFVKEWTGANIAVKVEKVTKAFEKLTDEQKKNAVVMDRVTKDVVELAKAGAILPPQLDRIALQYSILTSRQEIAEKVSRVLTKAFLDQHDATLTNSRSLSAMEAEIRKLIPVYDEALKIIGKLGQPVPLAPPPPLFSQGSIDGMNAAAVALDAIGANATGAKSQVMAFAAQFVLSMSQVKNSSEAAALAASTAWAAYGLFVSAAVAQNISRNKALNDSIKETQDSIKRLFELTRTNDMAANLALLGLTIDDLKGMKLNEWADVVQAAFDRLDAAMERAGLSLADLEDPADTFSALAKQLADDMAQLISRGFTLTQITKGNASALNEVLAAAFNTGTKVPAALRPMLETLLTSGQLSDDLRRKFLGLAEPAPWKDMESFANEFGISLADLGPKFQQSKLSETAEEFARKFQLLVDNGADVGAVIAGMGTKANEFLNNALKWGIELPASIRPLIEKMFEAGELVDENGKKITDLSKVKFGQSLADEMQPLLEALNKLIEALTTDAPAAFRGLAREWGQIRSSTNWNIPSPSIPNGFGVGDTGSSGESSSASFARSLSPAAFMSSASVTPSAGRGTMQVNFVIGNRTLARELIPFIPGAVSDIGVRAR